MSASETKSILPFIGLLLLAGIANLFSRGQGPAPDTLMACVNYITLVSLLLFWTQSVFVRLLPSGAKNCTLSAALLLMMYLLLRIFKYRFAVDAAAMRYAVYAYWVPQMLVPALFLMTCICIRRGERQGNIRQEILLLIPAVLLSLLVLTNDLHALVYVPHVAPDAFALTTGTYSLGPVIWLLYGWMVLESLGGLMLLFREAGRVSKRMLRILSVLVLLWAGLVLLNTLFLDRYSTLRLFNVPEIHTFGMLGLFELCIRNRLIPCNENYSGFFGKLHTPAVITDRWFRVVYHTQTGLCASPAQLQAALTEPVSLTPDRKLCGKALRSGHAFWVEDESGVHRAQEQLQETNELIEQENDLIHAETEQKKQDAYLRSRHRIYHEIAAELYPVQLDIREILSRARPGTDSFRQSIAQVCVLNAYVKRKTNLLLLASEQNNLSLRELYLAIQESANYLTLAGLPASAQIPGDVLLPARRMIALYDTFFGLSRQLLGAVPSMMVSWNDGVLRIATETDRRPDTQGLPLPVRFRSVEGVLYMMVPAGGEEDEQ